MKVSVLHLRWLIWISCLVILTAWIIFDQREVPVSDAVPVNRQGKVSGRAGTLSVTKALAPKRPRMLPSSEPLRDPFSSKSWLVQVVDQPVPEEHSVPIAVAPIAPSIPFKYLGILEDMSGHQIVQLDRSGQSIIVEKGEVIDGQYRLDEINEEKLIFTHVHSSERLTLTLPER